MDKKGKHIYANLILSWDKIKEMTRTEIKSQIREWDTETWKKKC